jgi:hypothetical protein
VSEANILNIMKEYESKEQSDARSDLFIRLKQLHIYSQNHAMAAKSIRAQLLQNYEHEFRAHHFFNAYGQPRSVHDIVLAYFLTWKKEQNNQFVSTVPYKGRELVYDYLWPLGMVDEHSEHKLTGSFLQMNPIQSSEFSRVWSWDAEVNDTRPNTYDDEPMEKLENKLDIDALFKSERGYEGWIQTQFGGEHSHALEKFREINGWTHRINDALVWRMQQRFNINLSASRNDYNEYLQRQLLL